MISAAFAAVEAERARVSANRSDCPPSLTDSTPRSTVGPLMLDFISKVVPSYT